MSKTNLLAIKKINANTVFSFASSLSEAWVLFIQSKTHSDLFLINLLVQEASEQLVKQLETQLAAIPPNLSIKICPIPVRSNHLLKRGFSPQHLLAEQICRKLFKKRAVSLSTELQRRKNSPSQTGKSRQERLVQQEYSLVYKGQASDFVLLIDDVITTGGTLIEAERAIKQTGAQVLACLSLFYVKQHSEDVVQQKLA